MFISFKEGTVHNKHQSLPCKCARFSHTGSFSTAVPDRLMAILKQQQNKKKKTNNKKKKHFKKDAIHAQTSKITHPLLQAMTAIPGRLMAYDIQEHLLQF